MEGAQPDPDDRGGVVALLHDGSNKTVPGGASSWQVLDATPAFRPTLGLNWSPKGDGAGDGSYTQVGVCPLFLCLVCEIITLFTRTC